MELATYTILVLNLFLLIGLIIVGRWWQQKHGRLADNRFVFILLGYFSFSFVSTLLPALIAKPSVILIVDLIFLLLIWLIGYPWIHWLIKQFTKRDK